MQTISASDLARHTREVLDKVVWGGEVVGIERNHALMAQIGPADRTMTATQALAGLPLPNLTAAQGAAWLERSLWSSKSAHVPPCGPCVLPRPHTLGAEHQVEPSVRDWAARWRGGLACGKLGRL